PFREEPREVTIDAAPDTGGRRDEDHPADVAITRLEPGRREREAIEGGNGQGGLAHARTGRGRHAPYASARSGSGQTGSSAPLQCGPTSGGVSAGAPGLGGSVAEYPAATIAVANASCTAAVGSYSTWTRSAARSIRAEWKPGTAARARLTRASH